MITGRGHCLISLHGEVSGDGDIYALHEVIDHVEEELRETLGCEAVIHMDPVAADDEETMALKIRVEALLKELDPRITMHDFRIVHGASCTRLIFDAVVPDEAIASEEEAGRRIQEKIQELGDQYKTAARIDRFSVK